MENWEFLLQRKGDKSWLPLESPTVEILEGQYRIASRSEDLANELVGIAIDYRPLADLRHQPIQQKIVKRISNDGLLIVMPYTSFTPGIWQIDCVSAEPASADKSTPWRKTVKFDVIQVSVEFGSEWQYNDDADEANSVDHDSSFRDEENAAIANDLGDFNNLEGFASGGYTNILGITQTDPTPLSYSSPILDIAEQRSTELVESMFEEFSLFEEDEENEEREYEDADRASEQESSDRLSGDNRSRSTESPLANAEEGESSGESEVRDYDNQPRSLIQLQQLQYIVENDNSFMLTGTAYKQGEVEIILKDPQTLEAVVQQRFPIERTSLERSTNSRRGIAFAHKINVPPPSTIQVLIGEVIIHTPTEGQDDPSALFITQQAIAVSYPAARVLPEIIKEAQKYQVISQVSAATTNPPSGLVPPIAANSYPQPTQSFPQAESQPKPTPTLSLPPIPSNRRNAPAPKPQGSSSISLPPLPPLPNPTNSSSALDLNSSSFPQSSSQSNTDGNLDLGAELLQDQMASNLAEFEQESGVSLVDYLSSDPVPNGQIEPEYDQEQELTYSFEEDLPQNYEELLEQSHVQAETEPKRPLLPRNVGSRFLNKLQNLSAEAIAAQKESQRNEDLLLDSIPSDRPDTIPSPEILAAAIDLQQVDLADQTIRTIQEANSLAELDQELEEQLDRLTLPNSDRILHEYVWEETVDPNTFPTSAPSDLNLSADHLTQTAQTIRNIQDTSSVPLADQVPIPTPEILVPTGEIISGTPMIVTVRLPAIAPKCFIKFWIKDLQTRTIIDGPRWLLDFTASPNSEYIETRTNISIPLSSIDVAFEAITLEAQTQRESHKTRVTRAVTPPNFAQDLNNVN